MIICIVGPSCAGKTTTCEYIQKSTGVPFIEASEYVNERFSSRSRSEPVLDFVINEFEANGMETFARDIVEDLQLRTFDDIIICGFRAAEEIELIHSKFPRTTTIGVYANSLLRYQRKLKRDNPNSEYSYEDFIKKDFIEYNFGIMESLEERAVDILINESSFETHFQCIENRIIGPYLS